MRTLTLVSLAFLAVNTGCVEVRPLPAAAPRVRAAGEDADLIAQEAVSARVTMALHLDRVAHMRIARRLVRLGGWDEVVSDIGLDPLREVQRAFVAARSSRLDRAVIVMQHSAEEARVSAAIAGMRRAFEEAHGRGADLRGTRASKLDEWIRAVARAFPEPGRYPFPAAYHVRAWPSTGIVLVAAPQPGLLVVLPPSSAGAAFRMAEGAGLPEPSSGEAMVLRAWDPEQSILDGPAWAREVRYAEVVLAFDGEGGGTLRFRALCSSPEAAREQARVLTSQAEQAQTVSIAGARLRLFDAIELHAERERVRADVRFLAHDIDWWMAMTEAPF
jgi:hypothetical protein